MKHTVALFLLIFPIMVQSHSIAVDGKEWTIHSQVVYPTAPLITHKMRIEGDTVINGREYKKLYYSVINEYGEVKTQIQHCHQEGDAFYKNGVKMFDFSLQPGDNFHLGSDLLATVIHVDTIVLNDGIPRKCLSMGIRYSDTEVSQVLDQWIEGIGSFDMGIYDNSIGIGGVTFELQSVTLGRDYIYKKSIDADSEFPSSPIVNKVTFIPEAPTTDDEVQFEIELGIFTGNYTYKQKIDSIVGCTVYTSATYNRYGREIVMFDHSHRLSLGKLKEGEYTLRHNIRGLNGSAPTDIDTTYIYTFNVTDAKGIKAKQNNIVNIKPIGSTLFYTSSTAVKLEVYTLDAVKVGKAAFVNGKATVKVSKVPATYLYVVTYPDGRRESGKMAVGE